MLWKLYNYQLKLPELTRQTEETQYQTGSNYRSSNGECPWIQHNQPREAPGFYLNDSTEIKKGKYHSPKPYPLLHFLQSLKSFLTARKEILRNVWFSYKL